MNEKNKEKARIKGGRESGRNKIKGKWTRT